MIFTPEAYFVVQDISDRSRQLTVVAEADSRVELERYQRDKGLSRCETYKEQGESLYRLICERRAQEVRTDALDQYH